MAFNIAPLTDSDAKLAVAVCRDFLYVTLLNTRYGFTLQTHS